MNLYIKKFLIYKTASIQDALTSLVGSGSKCLIVVDSKNRMLGTLSDGDLRKAILKGKKLSYKISTIFNKKPKYLLEDSYTELKAQNLFLKFLVDIIPIITSRKIIVKIIKMDDVFKKTNKKIIKKNSIPVVIMAGGKGARLEPFTSILPKPLIPINGKPIIDHIIDKFNDYCVSEYFLSINHKSRIIKAFFDERQQEKNISFIEEKKPLGTIGALSKIAKSIKPIFIVTNCDILINCDYEDIIKYHKKNKNMITIVASFRNYTIPYGDCKINKDGLLVKINEKPNISLLANTGMYIMNREVISQIPKNTRYDLPQLLEKLINLKKRIGVFPVSEEAWVDIGQWNEYKKALNKLNFED